MVGNPNAWWGTEPIHGGEATYMVAWPASRPALVGARLDGGKAGLRGWPGGIWVPHHVYASKVSGIRYQNWFLMK